MFSSPVFMQPNNQCSCCIPWENLTCVFLCVVSLERTSFSTEMVDMLSDRNTASPFLWMYVYTMYIHVHRSGYQKGKKKKGCLRPGSNWGPCACEAHVITTTPQRQHTTRPSTTLTSLQYTWWQLKQCGTYIPVRTLQEGINKCGLEVESVDILWCRLVRHIRKTVPHPRVSFT